MIKTYLAIVALVFIMMLVQTKFTRVLDVAKVSLAWPWEAAKIFIERMDDDTESEV